VSAASCLSPVAQVRSRFCRRNRLQLIGAAERIPQLIDTRPEIGSAIRSERRGFSAASAASSRVLARQRRQCSCCARSSITTAINVLLRIELAHTPSPAATTAQVSSAISADWMRPYRPIHAHGAGWAPHYADCETQASKPPGGKQDEDRQQPRRATTR